MKRFFFRDAPAADCKLPKLFCFPASGGLGSGYLPWAEKLSGISSVVGIDLPGRGVFHKDPRNFDMNGLIAWFSEQITPSANNCIFYGHSFGAFCAFETARYLYSSLGIGPKLVIVGAAASPLLQRPDIDTADEQSLISFITTLGGTPNGVLENQGLRSLYLPGVKRDIDTLSTYVPDPEPAETFGIAAFAGRDDPIVDPESVARWREMTKREFHMQVIDGGHFFYNDNPELFFSALSSYI